MTIVDPHASTAEPVALMIGDLQNDFLHVDGAYGRAGLHNKEIAALPERIKPLADRIRQIGGLVVSTQFTIESVRGKPLIADHLGKMRPFLKQGDFASGSWGHRLVDELNPADIVIEKVAYSAFYASRLEWLLRKCSIEKLFVCGIVTNGGIASTVRDACVRDFETVVLRDGCAAFNGQLHEAAIDVLSTVCRVATIAEVLDEIGEGRSGRL